MKHPFHAIIADAEGKYLFGACSDRVQKYNLSTGKLEAEYVLPGGAGPNQQKETVDSPPRKKVKTQENGDDQNDDKEKPVSSGANKQEGVHAIRTINFSRDGKHLIGTESKSVHVLDSQDLSIFSQRTFPKRPSSVATSADDKFLLVGDKFGDVYSVPLLSKEPLVLSSSEAAKENQASSIEPILGHVSMLVDLTVASSDNKEYVITADRDEHIRVSKFPESYIVERWLFGHKEFVSVLCVLPWASDILVSGGGDDFLAVWNWTTGELIQKFDIRSLITSYLTEEYHVALRKGSDLEISVSAIVPLPKFNQIAVICEATNAILVLQFDNETKTLKHLSSLELPTRVIDITGSSDGSTLIASLDGPELVKAYTTSESGQLEPLVNSVFNDINQHGSVEKAEGDSEFPLYSIKHLRKRGEF